MKPSSTTETPSKGVFGARPQIDRLLNTQLRAAEEWWLNVDYAEIIELQEFARLQAARRKPPVV